MRPDHGPVGRNISMQPTNPSEMNRPVVSPTRPGSWAALALGVGLCGAATGEIISIAGRVEATISERLSSGNGRNEASTISFPGNALPLQVLSDLTTGEGDFPSAGAVASQFADP